MNRISILIVNLSLIFLCFLFFTTYNVFFIIKKDSIVKIRGGMPLNKVINELRRDSILNPMNEKFFLRATDGSVKAGHYKAFNGETIFDFARRVVSGESEMCIVTFVPGKTVKQYVEQINSDDNFYGDVKRIPYEGSILPESYKHKCQSQREKVFEFAQYSMSEFVDNALRDYDFTKSHLKSKFDVLIMASIIEKETGIVEEMSKISSVFQNRMKIGMKLQTDPTVIYQVSNEVGFLERSLTLDDLKSRGAWNTYVISGLPLTPISNPSREAILSAMNPAKTDYLFFVASNNGGGGHVFAKTYGEHLKNVDAYRKYIS